jgi:hypothetical protein
MKSSTKSNDTTSSPPPSSPITTPKSPAETNDQTTQVYPIFIDTSDSQAVHVTLDEHLPTFFSNKLNLNEDYTSSIYFIFFSILSILIVAVLHGAEWYYKYPPYNQYTLPAVGIFFVIQLYMNFCMGTPNLLYKSLPYKLNGAQRQLKVYVRHQLYKTDYNVKLVLYSFATKKEFVREETFQVTQFFTTKGLFLEDEFQAALEGLYNKVISMKKQD